jgi:hypothetical protein
MRDEEKVIQDEEPRCHPFLFILHPFFLPHPLLSLCMTMASDV